MRDWKSCVGIVEALAIDFADLELRVYANCIKENKRASRMPARKRKASYGKHKLPWSIIHDEYICHKQGGFL
ncbi:hypothetical protein Kp7_2 [Klebsiella phage Kp7]|uniref:Uncharacterized protein n=1 Tax=Klebsiella phage Kp7 TaxID=2936515 RepID=A0AAE9KXI5_9CAUD|nr:hypothetical protein Kp7_2 [Klebsiella phage Kp7]